MKVQCPSCKKQCHETTDAYDPDIPANGSMVRLLDPWNKWGWGKFGNSGAQSATVLASEMFCPCCDGLLAPSGRLKVVEDTPKRRDEALEHINVIPLDAAPLPVKQEAGNLLNGPPFICSECGWEGKTKPSLKRHVTMEHNHG